MHSPLSMSRVALKTPNRWPPKSQKRLPWLSLASIPEDLCDGQISSKLIPAESLWVLSASY